MYAYYVDASSAYFFVVGSIALLDEPGWGKWSLGFFILGSMLSITRSLYYSGVKELCEHWTKHIQILGHVGFVVGSIIVLTDSLRNVIFAGALSFSIGSFMFLLEAAILLWKRFQTNRPIRLYHWINIICAMLFLAGSVFYLPSIGNNNNTNGFFISGSALLFCSCCAVTEIPYANRLSMLSIGLVAIVAELFVVYKITWAFDDSVSVAVNYIALFATFLSISNNLPQLFHTYEIKTVGDFSLISLLVWFISAVIWLIYAFYINNGPLIVNNFVAIGSVVFLLYYKAIYKKNNHTG